MWIVRLALNRPYTFIVLALLILILSPEVILRTRADVFPNIPSRAKIKLRFAKTSFRKSALLHSRLARPGQLTKA